MSDTAKSLNFTQDVLELALNSSGIGIWEFDLQSGDLRWSPGLFKLTGLPENSEPTMEKLQALIHDDDRERVKTCIDESVAAKRQYDIEYRNVHEKDGKIVWGRHVGRTIYNEAGEPIRMIGASYDITHIKQAEQRAEAADRAKSQFLANMSHEIRTPMNGVMGMAELLAATELNTKQKGFANIIIKSGEALLTIINDILDFSKIDAGQMELHPESFDLADAIEDVAILVSASAAEKDLELAVRFAPDLPRMLVGDAGRIRQVVTNLMSNAVKFTEKGHVFVDISGDVSGGSDGPCANLEIRIEDTGVGISEEKQATIFDKFTQVDNTATRAHEGTGLGLSISRSLIELMGGKICLESTLGKGSVFFFTIELPVHEGAQQPNTAPIDVTGSRILIIDDNAVNRTILEEQMQAWRFAGKSVASGEEGIALLRAAPSFDSAFDAVIIDYHMPGMNGVEVAQIIRADSVIGNTPIVMLTSVDQTNIGHDLAGLNVQGHLVKPAKASHLLESLVLALQENKKAPLERPMETLQSSKKTELIFQAGGEEEENTTVDILIAEDNEVNKMVYTQILGSTDYKYEVACNGLEAVEMFKKLKPRLIIMDVSMPEMNGLDATGKIREIEAETGTHTPIVGATAHAMSGDMEKCLDAGMDDYLSKPISPNRLTDKIHEHLKNTHKASVAKG